MKKQAILYTPITPQTPQDFGITPSYAKTLTGYASKLQPLMLLSKHVGAWMVWEGRVPDDNEMGLWMSESFTELVEKIFNSSLIESR